jgi:phosphatidylglycerophosphate synthase
MSQGAAIIICAESAELDTRLLGLTIGERTLLALQHAGVQAVCFVGDGPHPESDRASLEVVDAAQLDTSVEHLVLPSDAVFGKDAVLSGGGVLARKSGDELRRWLEAPEEFLRWAEKSEATTGPAFALRASDRKRRTLARKALLRSLRKPIDGLVSRHLNRHLSLATTRLLVQTGLPPNFFTVLFMLLGLIAAGFAAWARSPWMLVAAGACVQAQSILDGCDGEMARLTYRFSKLGQWLDSIGDDLTNYAFCFGLAVGQARIQGDPSLYWFGGCVLLMQLTASGLLYRRMFLLGTGDLLAIPDTVANFEEKNTPFFRFVGFLRQLFKRDSFVFILAVITAAQLPVLAFSLFAFGTVVAFGGVVLNERRLSQMERRDSELVSA